MQYEEILQFVHNLVGDGDELLQWVYKRSDELRGEGVYQIDPSSGRFLELLARLRSPKLVLEIGSAVGYSALWFMKGMQQDGILDAIEVNPKTAKALETTMRKAGLVRRIRIHLGEALKILPTLKEFYDIVFIDADKEQYPEYLEHALRLTRSGSVIVADDVLKDLSPVNGEKSSRQDGIARYTRRIFSDERLSSLIVPVGDGLALSCRTK